MSSDARSLTDVDALGAQVKAEFDTFDLLFVNAGFSIPTPRGSVTEDIYDEMFNLNVKGPLFAVQKIRVNAVSPGPIDTGILEKVLPTEEMRTHVRGHTFGIIPMT